MSAFFSIDFMEVEAISYTQFIAACISQNPDYLQDERIFVVFRNVDIDNDGAISNSDFESFLKQEFGEPFLKTEFGVGLIEEFKSSSYNGVSFYLYYV